MDYNTISKLLDKYFEGKSSLEEEEQLRDYFGKGDITEELQIYAPLFQHFTQERALQLSDQFDVSLMQKLKASSGSQARQRSLYSIISKAAAVLLLVIGTFWVVQNITPNSAMPTAQEKAEAKAAYNQAMAALMLVSAKLNEGKTKGTKKIGEVEKLSKIIKNK